MKTTRFHDWIGLSGVDSDENPTAKRWARRLEFPILLVALTILVSWYFESLLHEPLLDQLINWLIWLFFLCETTLLTVLVTNKRNYLSNNWLNLVIILFGVPILWLGSPLVGGLRALRLLLFLTLMLQLFTTVRQVLAKNNLSSVLMISLIFIIVAGFLIAGIDPNIQNPVDGIWWAWVTATTVGYGDVVPTSPEGRMLGGILILLGVGLTSLITANISVYFISRSRDQGTNEKLDRIERHLQRLEHKLDQFSSKQE